MENTEGDWGDLLLVEVSLKDQKSFSRYTDCNLFSVSFDFYRDQTRPATEYILFSSS